jgi:hypothetical protein
MKIKRYIYHFKLPMSYNLLKYEDKIYELVKQNRILTFFVAEYCGEFFSYTETTGTDFTIKTIINEAIEARQMFDIFHYTPDLECCQWVLGRENPKGVFKISRLKHDKISSYIFHHYRLQEEYRGERPKYGIIGIDGDLLAMYMEEPVIKCDPMISGKLDTNDSPRKEWGSIMDKHFSMSWQNCKSVINIFREDINYYV